MRIIIGILIATIVLVVMPAGMQAQSDEGLVAEWHFDEGAGSVLKDSSGNGNDGVIYGATWVEGMYGGALEFDGMDDYVEVPDSPSLDITDAITVELWVNPTTLGDWDLLVHKINAYGIGYSFVDFPAILGDKNKFEFHIVSTDYWTCCNSVNSPIPGKWYHIIGTLDGKQHKIYVNGNLEGTVSYSGPFSTTDYPLIFGGYFDHILPTHSQEYLQKYLFNGIIDEVRIYDRALSAEEIKSHYNGVGLIVTKTTSLHSIKQGQTTTISLDLKNSYLTEIKNIELVDIIPSDRIQVSGETSKTFASLQPKDSIEFQYILQIDKAGTCNLDPATVTFADEKGNYYIVKSNVVTIEVIPTPTTTSTPASTLAPTPIQTSTPILTSTLTQTPTSMSTTTPPLQSDLSPPSISILNPVIIEYNNNGLLEEGEKVKITYGSNDLSGVSSVKIMLDGVMLESRNQAGTYTVTTNSLPVGRHTIRVEATDSKSNYNSEELPIIVERTGPSVYFGTTRTTINKGEDAIFTLSAVNPIGNPQMNIQLILKPPSGVSVTSSSFARGASGIYTCTQTIESGDNVRSIEVRLNGNQAGTHEIESEVYYMFEGSSKSPTRYETLTLTIDPKYIPDDFDSEDQGNGLPGFAAVVAVMGFLVAACFVKVKIK